MFGSFGSSTRRPGRSRLSVVLALVAVTLTSVAVTGCAATPAASISPTPSSSATAPGATPSAQPADTAEPADTATPAPDATPAAEAITPETPLDALGAWTICKALGDGGNQSVHVHTRVYDTANIPPAAGRAIRPHPKPGVHGSGARRG